MKAVKAGDDKEACRKLWYPPGVVIQPRAMLDGIAQRDQATETDATEEDRTVAKLADQAMQHGDVVVLIDEQRGLVGDALAEQVERSDPEPTCDQRVAIRAPKLGGAFAGPSSS